MKTIIILSTVILTLISFMTSVTAVTIEPDVFLILENYSQNMTFYKTFEFDNITVYGDQVWFGNDSSQITFISTFSFNFINTTLIDYYLLDYNVTIQATAPSTPNFLFFNISRNDTSLCSVNRTDISNGLYAFCRKFSESAASDISLRDVFRGLFGGNRQTTNALSVTGLTAKLSSFIRSSSNGMDFAETIVTSLTRLRTLTQSLGITDSIQALFTRVRQVTEALDLTDVTTRLLSLTRSLSNAIDLTESITASLGRFRQATQALDITDNIQIVLTRIRFITNALNIIEVVTRLASFARSLTNAVDLTEAIQSSLGRFRQASQAFGLNDAITSNLTRFRAITNAIDLTEAVTRLASFTRTLTNAINLTELIDRFRTLPRQITNSMDLTGTVTRIVSFTRSLTNAIDLNEAITATLGRLRQIGETLDVTDEIIRLLSFKRLSTNAINITEAITRIASFTRSLSDAIDLTDSIIRNLSLVRQFTNAVDLTDSMSKIASFTRSLTSSISTTESMARLVSFIRLLTNAVDLNDAASRLVSFQRLLTQALDLAELQSKLSMFQRITSLQFLITATTSPIFKTISATFILPVSSVAKGEFIEFDSNIHNTGTEPLNASVGIEIRNLTHLVTTINSSNVTLSNGQGKTIINFLNTINMSPDRYRVDATIFYDDRATTKITKIIDINDAANIQIGNYTNTSITFTANTPTLITANTSVATTTNISIVLNSTNEGGIGISEFSAVQNQTISDQTKLGKFIHVRASPNITDNLRWYWLNISYTDAQVLSAGVTESTLRIWFYNATTNTWQQETNSGVDTSSNYVWANVTHFSLFGLYATTVPSAPSGGGEVGSGGGGAAVSITSSTQLPTTSVEFTKWSLLKEIRAGESIVESISIKSKTVERITNLHAEISGIPTSWVSVFPESIELEAEKTSAFNLVITVPNDIAPGDYKVLITLKNSNVEDSAFMILRVKNYPKGYDIPIITRAVQLDYENNKTKVSLDVNNPVRYYKLVELQEEIPKPLAQSAREIQFEPYPDEILREDPLVQWNLREMVINDTRKLSYITKGILDDFTGYVYFPLKELSLIETKLPTGLKVVDISLEPLFAGRSSIGKVTVENIGEDAKKLEFSMHLPPGWKILPEKIEASIGVHERREFKFSIVVPEDVSQGDYIGTSILVWGQDTYIRESVLHVSTLPSYLPLLIVLGGLGGAVAYFVYKSRKARERPLTSKLRMVASKIKIEFEPVAEQRLEKEISSPAKIKTGLAEDLKDEMKRKIMSKLKQELEKRMYEK